VRGRIVGGIGARTKAVISYLGANVAEAGVPVVGVAWRRWRREFGGVGGRYRETNLMVIRLS